MSETKYTYAVGRRKTAVAEVRLYKGKGANTANGVALETYVKRADLFGSIYAPLKTA
jgi:small subunit ribosomal protein S9